MTLDVRGLKKQLGHRDVLRNVSLSVHSGEVVGLVGPNGAGKSTTMKILLGLMSPGSGTIQIEGVSPSQNRSLYLRNIAGCVDGPPQYPILNAQQHLQYVARLRGVDQGENVHRALRRVGLSVESTKPVSRFSMGMKQRLSIAMVLLQSPKFMIFDEPMNGLDPAATIEFRELIRSLADEDRVGILISSHMLSEIERICDRVVFIRTGEVTREIKIGTRDLRALLTLRTSNNDLAARILAKSEAVDHTEIRNERLLISAFSNQISCIAKILVNEGIDLFELSPARDLLEADYLEEFEDKEMLS